MGKQKIIYAPGELAKIRDRLGNLDKEEAKRMSQVLGGEIGYERSEEQEPAIKGRRVRNETVEVNIGGKRPQRHIDITADEEDISEEDIREYQKRKAQSKKEGPADDPSVSIKPSYWDRVKIDKYCGLPEFEIKNSTQIMISMVSILNDPVDSVNPAFVLRRMNNYYKRIELLVTAVRTLLPRNNLKRNERFKKASPFSYAILDTIRYWNIDQISTELSRIQARPRSAKTTDFIEILRNIYKPLYILEQLELETHIKGAFTFLYKLLYIENPTEAKNKYQELIRSALFSFGIIRRDIRFQLYPLLMKLVSHCWLPYETFFQERRNRIKTLLQANEQNQISPKTENDLSGEKAEEITNEKGEAENTEVSPETKTVGGETKGGKDTVEEPVSEEERTKRQTRETESKALERGLATLESIFPTAGWNQLNEYPDLYPYFSDVFKLKKAVVLIAPTDPLHQTYFLARILEELFFGLRYTVFGTIIGPDGNPERLDEPMSRIINQWQNITESGFEKEYLSRLNEYCQMLENAAESRTSNYAKRLLNELRWIKRLFFLPYYRFDSIMASPIQKNSITALYPEVRSLRRYLAAVAAGIEQGNRQGGAEKKALCDGITNPWDTYVFQVPNPVSTRLGMLLAPKKRNNASLVYFALAVTVVLDSLLNDENSWAYDTRNDFLFRSENNEGVRPLFGVDSKVNTEMLFKQALKRRQVAAAQTEAVK
jgi:hypothetical protein